MGEIDEWEIKRDTHNETLEYYNDMRKLIIITNFLDYFNRTTDNLLTNRTLPHSTGFGSIFTNLGRLQNRGL